MSDYPVQISALPASIFDTSPGSFMEKLWQIHEGQREYLDQLEDDTLSERDPGEASGDLLDLLGEIVREPRQGRDDDAYRIYLYIAIQRKRSNGSIEALNEILRAIMGEDFIEIRPLFPDQQGRFDWTNDEEYTLWLDGSRFLDGRWLLSGTLFQPGAMQIRIKATTPPAIKQYVQEILPLIVDATALFFLTEV